MDEELEKIAVALGRNASALERIAAALENTKGVSIDGQGELRPDLPGRPAKKGAKGDARTIGKSRRGDAREIKRCRKCGNPAELYLGGHGLGECCRPVKGQKPRSLKKRSYVRNPPKARRKKTKGMAKAQASVPATGRAEERRFVPIPVKPSEASQATSRAELVAVQDMLASFVYSMRDRNVGEKEILWEITHRAAGKGITLTDAQASDIYSKILQNPRPC